MPNAPAQSHLEDRDLFWKGSPTRSSSSSHLRRKGQYQQELDCLADRLARSIRYRISVSASYRKEHRWVGGRYCKDSEDEEACMSIGEISLTCYWRPAGSPATAARGSVLNDGGPCKLRSNDLPGPSGCSCTRKKCNRSEKHHPIKENSILAGSSIHVWFLTFVPFTTIWWRKQNRKKKASMNSLLGPWE